MTTNNSIILINNNYLGWITKHPEKFVNSIASRILSEEADPYPGYARWSGDAILGVQVIHAAPNTASNPLSSMAFIVDVNSGKKIMSFFNNNKEGDFKSQEIILLKRLASKLGYSVIKTRKTNFKHKNNKKNSKTYKSKKTI